TTQTAYGSSGARTETTTFSDGSFNIRFFSYGRLQSATRKDSGGNTVLSTTYTYDPHGRNSGSTDLRNGTTSFTFNAADLVTSTTSPDPGTGPQVSSTSYDNLLRPISVTQPDGTVVNTAFY